jgi:hypothetical protein
MRAAYFDIETEMMPENWDRREQLAITCGALFIDFGDGNFGRTVFWAGRDNVYPGYDGDALVAVDDVASAMDSGAIPVNKMMTESEVSGMFDTVASLTFDPDIGGGGRIFTWNGVNFDFPAIASNIPHRLEDIAALALNSYDPWLQFVRTLGWPIALERVSVPMLGREKVEGISGSQAGMMWPIEAPSILRYCAGDAELLRDVVAAMTSEKQVRWMKQSGQEGKREIEVNGKPGWYKVKKLIELPEPNRSWMSDYTGQLDLYNLISWMEEKYVGPIGETGA